MIKKKTEDTAAKKNTAKRTSYRKTPTIYQMEATECGAASLSMIFGYYGSFQPLEKMRIETGVSRDGCNAKNILRAARKYGFEAKGYRKTLEGLMEVPVPCIIHWNFNHFVVFEGQKGNYYYLNDPATGRRKLTKDELDEGFTGVVLTFKVTDKVERVKKNNTLGSFIRIRLKGQYADLIALFLMGLLLVIPGMLIPIFSEVFVDEILLGTNKEWTSKLLAIMAGTLLFKAFFSFYQGTLLENLKAKLSLISGHKMIYHLFRLPMEFFDQRYAGDLVGRVQNNTQVNEFLAGDLANTVLDVFVACFYFLIMLQYSVLLTMIGLVSVVINLVSVKLSSQYIENNSKKMQQDAGKLAGALVAGLSITSTIKASGAENAYVSRILGYNAKTIRLEQENGRIQQLLNSIPSILSELSNIIVLMLGGVLVMKGTMTAGMLVAYTTLLESFTQPVNKLVQFAQRIQTLKADMGRVEDVLKYDREARFNDQEDEKKQKKQKMTTKLTGRIDFSNIAFGYSILKPPLVENFNFHLDSGRSIALVGSSGCGKSTVAKIVSGLYRPWEGEVRLDGILMNEIPAEIMCASVSTVSQEIALFSGSIRDNITMWNRKIMEQDIIRAAKDACIHDIITQKPGAYEYDLEEGGMNLSGGQRQRLEIARALVTNPTILIMDEATSALDPIVEKEIVDNIKRRGCTCVIVAHRLSAIRDCDEIVVMDAGKIVQRGTHEELLNQPGHYQRLVQTI